MPAHPIANKYDEMKTLFSVNPPDVVITDKFEKINRLCQSEINVLTQKRVLDGAFGVGRFLCLLTCINETNFYSNDMFVALTCVPNQWINYQLFIAQIKRAYYLDVP